MFLDVCSSKLSDTNDSHARIRKKVEFISYPSLFWFLAKLNRELIYYVTV